MEINTPGGVLSTVSIQEDEYPCIQVSINGQIAAIVEFCAGDGTNRMMIRAYSKENDEPVSLNWETGEVLLDKNWNGEISHE